MNAYRNHTNMAIDTNVRLNSSLKFKDENCYLSNLSESLDENREFSDNHQSSQNPSCFNAVIATASMVHRSDSYASLHGADADDESQPITHTRQMY